MDGFGDKMLSLNEIRARAAAFAERWKGAHDEKAEAKSFWDELFQVFGTPRRNVAQHEARVRMPDGSIGFIDLLWKGKLIVEHKSRGKDLAEARRKAQEYVHQLKPADRPEWMVVCDFARFELIHLTDGREYAFILEGLPGKIELLGFLGGFTPRQPQADIPVNLKAVELLGDLYDSMRLGGYSEHDLPRFLVRVLFALFAEDTGLFEPEAFRDFVLDHSHEDGGDLGRAIDDFFEVLNTPKDQRQAALADLLKSLPYVNGTLFAGNLPKAAMTRSMRQALLKCTEFDWTRISPAIFGSLFQGVMGAKARRAIGAHYTSEENILRLIGPLFLDELKRDLTVILAEKSKRRRGKLLEFHDRLASLKFLDPACGCGNFLIITYRELRRLEIALLRALDPETHGNLDVSILSRLNVDAMHGIEISEFPADIARVALWLMDHICNQELSAAFGQYFARLPLTRSANIAIGNALRLDWAKVLPPGECSFVLGNPPFAGAKYMSDEQRADMAHVFHGVKNAGLLDFVAGWYRKAAAYIQGTQIDCAFVSTNSVTQGEQVGVLWPDLFRLGIKIRFAHRTFVWNSEAKGKAHVHVVIVGFWMGDRPGKKIFDHADPDHQRVIEARNISPYLIDGSDTVITSRSTPLCDVPEIGIGNKPIDDGNYIFTPEEKTAFLSQEPKAEPFMRRFLGAEEFLNGSERWFLWLGDTPPSVLAKLPECRRRIEAVRAFREASKSPSTRDIARTPTRLHVENMPRSNYLVIPGVSSERRRHIPIGFMTPDVLASNLVMVTSEATIYHFGILSSLMHNAWMRQVAGRLKSDYRYSAGIVYNNFPWPETPTDKQKAAVEQAAQAVLDARALFPGETLANLYDPNLMPAELARAHAELDRAVDRCYRKEPFQSEIERVQYLFAMHERLNAPMQAAMSARKGRRGRAAK